MPRDLTGSVDSNVRLGTVKPVVLMSIRLASTTEYVWAGLGNLSWDGKTWQGIGNLGKLEGIAETASLQANGASATLSSVSPADMQDALTEIRVGRPVRIYRGFLNASNQLDGDPVLIYKGTVDKPSLNVVPDEKGGEIRIALESKMLDMQRVAPARLTSEEQKQVYPDDTGLDFTPAMVDTVDNWGF